MAVARCPGNSLMLLPVEFAIGGNVPEQGQDTTEYALLIGLVAGMVALGVGFLGLQLAGLFGGLGAYLVTLV